MNRRTFFRRIVGGIAAALAAPFLPRVPLATQGLMFHPDAFKLIFHEAGALTRLDVLYGWATLRPPRLDPAQYRFPASRLPV